MANKIQDWVHKFDDGGGNAFVRRLMVLCAFVALGVFYNMAAFQNFNNAEGMDVAQVARNISEGEGFTTDFIRPLSLHLVYNKAANQLSASPGSGAAEGEGTNGVAGSVSVEPTLEEAVWLERLQGNHPDLAHAPLYPVLLAGALKLNPFGFPDVAMSQEFQVYLPDLWVAMFNQILFFLAVWMLFGLGKKLFDEQVAWVSVVVFACAELYWRFSTSGLSTMALVLIFLGSVRCLVNLEEAARDAEAPVSRLWKGALLLGLLTGLGMMTRYSYGWLIIPVIGAVVALPHPRRHHLAGLILLVFVLVSSPWLVRNVALCGNPFGTSAYAVFAETTSFPEAELERSVTPDFREFNKAELSQKLIKNLRILFQEDLPQMGGSWVTAFFLVGLLVPFRSPALRQLRYFLAGCIGLLILIQAMGRTWVSEDSPIINSENLMVVVAPLVFLYGVSLFFLLMGQFGAKSPGARTVSAGIFCLIVSAPLILSLLPPWKMRISYPPYFPPGIQQKASFLEQNETMMSDIPWATAWYGNRATVWLTRDYRNPPITQYRNDFFEIHGKIRDLQALYISVDTLEKVKTQSLEAWIGRQDLQGSWEEYVRDWNSFLLIGIYLRNEIPTGFPLNNAPIGIFPELFLVDSEHIEPKSIQ